MTDIDPIYQEIILDLYRHPHNRGILEHADFDAEDSNPSCGDLIRLTIKFDGDVVREVAHSGQGCVISQAAVSLLTDYIKWKTKKELAQITTDDIVSLLGIPVSHTRIGCATLGLKILQKIN